MFSIGGGWYENVPKTWRHGRGAAIFLGMRDGGVTGGRGGGGGGSIFPDFSVT